MTVSQFLIGYHSIITSFMQIYRASAFVLKKSGDLREITIRKESAELIFDVISERLTISMEIEALEELKCIFSFDNCDLILEN